MPRPARLAALAAAFALPLTLTDAALGSRAVAGTSDARGPQVLCSEPDPGWHLENVVLHCRATAPDGLADRADAAFTLRTAVPAGTETTAASTGSRRVCDTTGACTTAGPVTGLRVDRKPPEIDLRRPDPGARYDLVAKHTVRFDCTDRGIGVAYCEGSTPDRSMLPTGLGSLGENRFTVLAVDRLGNRTVVRHSYTVEAVTPTTLQITNPDQPGSTVS